MSAVRVLLPKEHGAYGQIAFPLITVFAVAGVSVAGALLGAAAIAAFLAHEPAVTVLGLRGPRARRELSPVALRWLACCLGLFAAAAVAAALVMDPALRPSLAVPAVPALVFGAAMLAGREKSWYGETAAALAFAGVTIPVALAAGAGLDVGLAVAIPFAVLFATTTLAVRVVILRVRGGGNPAAAAATRRAAFACAAVATVLMVTTIGAGRLEPLVLVASAPGLLTGTVVAARPPSPARLRTLGWSLVAVSTLTAAIVIVAA